MTMTIKIVLAALVHILFFLVWIFLFIRLKRKIKKEISEPPLFDVFFLFMNYGALIFVMLTNFFWYWSGFASVMTFYLILVSPFVMGLIAHRNYKKRQIAVIYKRIFQLGFAYFIIAPLLFLMVYLIDG